MRDIKFRAYHTANKVMMQNKDLSVLAKNMKDDNVWKFMQYTGLKDKNGVEIYEGDIVNCQIKPHERDGRFWFNTPKLCYNGFIEYNERQAKYNIIFNPDKCNNLVSIEFGYHNEMFEIIGNIHQNPELL